MYGAEIRRKTRKLKKFEALKSLDPDIRKASLAIRVKTQELLASPDHLENYIILPGKVYGNYSYPDLLVSMDRYYQGSNWCNSHTKLHNDGFFMLTPRQFIDFISLLKSGNVHNGKGTKLDSAKVNTLLEDILKKKDPYRAEWLDADFKVVNCNLYINYNHRTDNGILKPQNTELLEPCLMKDCYIDLLSANKQGLPTKKMRKKDIYFYYPRRNNNSVARFDAGSGRVCFNCDGNPLSSNASLGVRHAKIF